MVLEFISIFYKVLKHLLTIFQYFAAEYLDIGIGRLRFLSTKGRCSQWYGHVPTNNRVQLGDPAAVKHKMTENLITIVGLVGRKTFQGMKALGTINRLAKDVEVFSNCWIHADSNCKNDEIVKVAGN